MFVSEILLGWLVCYIGLLGLYFVVGLTVSLINPHIHKKRGPIQNRTVPPGFARREIIQSAKSLGVIALFFWGGLYAQQTFLIFPPIPFTPINFMIMLLASLVLFDTWFYWTHRLIHTRWLFKRIHRWHHKALTPIVWSNNSDRILDVCFLQSYWLIAPLVLPFSPVVFIVHKIYDQVTGMIGHSGYEYSPGRFSAFPSPMIGVIFHDQHHRHSRYNFATHFSIWDRLMGTMHPDYDDLVMVSKNTGANMEPVDPTKNTFEVRTIIESQNSNGL